MGCGENFLIFDAWSFSCITGYSIIVFYSEVSVRVYPVAIHTTVSVLFVVDAMGDDHMVEAYSSIGLGIALYFDSNLSLCLPHLAEQRTLSMGIVLDAYG